MKRRAWTEAEIETVRRKYPHVKTERIAGELGRTVGMVYRMAQILGLRKTEEYLASPDACRLRRYNPGSVATQFKKGIVPHNTGLRRPGYAPGRMASTQFKPGARQGMAARNWRPMGTILPDCDGYLRIKVREGRKGEAYGFGNTKIWPLLQRHVWEQKRGPIPPSHVVVFRDGNRANCDIDNLELISRGDLCRRNSIHRLPSDLKEVVYLKGTIKAMVTKRRKKAA